MFRMLVPLLRNQNTSWIIKYTDIWYTNKHPNAPELSKKLADLLLFSVPRDIFFYLPSTSHLCTEQNIRNMKFY